MYKSSYFLGYDLTTSFVSSGSLKVKLWFHSMLTLKIVYISNSFLAQVLSVNAAKDATDLVAKLRAYHHTAQTRADKKHLSRLATIK